MASIGLTATFSKFQSAGGMLLRTAPLKSRVSLGFSPRHLQGSPRHMVSAACEPAKRGVNEMKKAGQEAKNEAASVADNVANKTKDAAGKATGTAENLADKAKQTAQEAWGSAKETAQKVKETVVGKADESAEFVKDNVESAKRSMNTK